MEKQAFVPTILFENDDVVVVDKPSGLSSTPDRAGKSSDMQHLLSLHVKKRLFAVTHLDKIVSGLSVYAKTPEANAFISSQLADGKGQTFIALVHGVPKEKKANINTAIRKFGSGRMGADAAKGSEASTRYEVMERFEAHALLRVNPLSDRRHQIRVHLFTAGHPIVGDPLYGDPVLQAGFPQILLHAHEITFESALGQRHHFTTPLSPAFGEMMKKIRV